MKIRVADLTVRESIEEENCINVLTHALVADLLMVIYLITIGYHDIFYEQEYFKHAREWESSYLCTAIGVIAVISTEVCNLK